ncbi:hypothetical protein T484DRAFT_1894880 [Baffinella frigidus]|nr:hypothetical protein T484DRAFT_1894880 [Cryptophyta sp. CCMP2293]
MRGRSNHDLMVKSSAGGASRIQLQIQVASLTRRLEEAEKAREDALARASLAEASQQRLVQLNQETEATPEGSLRSELTQLKQAVQSLEQAQRDSHQELQASQVQLKRRNVEAARDGRAIEELRATCERLQEALKVRNAPLFSTTASAPGEAMAQATPLSAQNNFPDSRRSHDGPHLAKRLPSPGGSAMLVSERGQQLLATDLLSARHGGEATAGKPPLAVSILSARGKAEGIAAAAAPRWAIPFDPLQSLTQSVSNVANLDPLQSFAKGASGLWGFSQGAAH